MVRLINEGMAILSFRESNFDAYSAYGEVIDNSIQANSTEIKIHMDYSTKNRGRGPNREPINYVAFGDNGHGMDAEVLHRCLQLGYSSRYNDRSGIGRFGVGATLAAINQCLKMEVYSKQSGGSWLYTCADIEEFTRAGSEQGLAMPQKKTPPDELMGLAGDDSGSIVIWSKYDRQPENASTMLSEAKIWIGRTYRKFIWDGVEIFLNNENMPAVDPLYVTTEKTLFPNDPTATEMEERNVTWPVSLADRQPGMPTESTIKIRMSSLPEEFRQNKGDGGSTEARRRYINRNEGISILRNGREVFHGHVPYWPKKFEEIDRWWGCEISFDAVLDRDFTVKNIKRGAVPVTELKKALHDSIRSTRKQIVQEVRDLWTANKVASEKTKTTGVNTTHTDAEEVAKKTGGPKNQLDINKNPKEESKKYVDIWIKDAEAQSKAAWQAKFESQPFTIIDDDWRGTDFMETTHLGGKSILTYNSRHPFHTELLAIRNDIELNEVQPEHAEQLKILIDIMLMAYGKSEAMFEPNVKMDAVSLLEQLRLHWGTYLSNYIKTWRDND